MSFPQTTTLSDLVVADVRGSSDRPSAEWLRSFEMVDQWHDELTVLLRRLNMQLSHMKEERAAMAVDLGTDTPEWRKFCADLEESRGKTLHFKMLVENRLTEAKRIRRDRYRESIEDVIISLRSAVQSHHDEVQAGADDDMVDERLWAAAGVA